jgi:hypothetical protein
MKGTTRRRVMARPFSTPTAPPVSTDASTATLGEKPSRIASAHSTPVRAIVEPTARSMPPPTMISVIPIAPSATITVCARTTLRLLVER